MNNNPLTEKIVVQPIIRQLPSKGLLYNNDELDQSVQNGEIKIYPLTGMDDIKIKSPDLLLSGEAVEQVIQGRCPQVNDVSNLFIQDVDYILFQMRLASYGDTMEMEHVHECKGIDKEEAHANPSSYTINLNSVLDNLKTIEKNELSDKFSRKMTTGQIVTFKPMRYKHMVKLMNEASLNSEDTSSLTDVAVNGVIDLIDSVDGEHDKDLIRDWLQQISTTDWHRINKQVNAIGDWGIEFFAHEKCKKCGEPIKIPITMNPLIFFTQP